MSHNGEGSGTMLTLGSLYTKEKELPGEERSKLKSIHSGILTFIIKVTASSQKLRK